MGGKERPFPTTTWGMISQLQERPNPESRTGFETLCRRYWKPVYYHLRIGRGRSNEDAKDLTQAFFLWILESDALRKYERERGSFRRYLKVLLGGFAGHEKSALERLKRGGGKQILSLDFSEASSAELVPDPDASDPAKVFDSLWVKEIIEAATNRVRARLSSTGREAYLRVYQKYDLVPEPQRPTYETLASELGLKVSDIRNYLFAVREMLRDEIRSEVSETTTDLRELENEWNALFGS